MIFILVPWMDDHLHVHCSVVMCEDGTVMFSAKWYDHVVYVVSMSSSWFEKHKSSICPPLVVGPVGWSCNSKRCVISVMAR